MIACGFFCTAALKIVSSGWKSTPFVPCQLSLTLNFFAAANAPHFIVR